MKVHTRDEINNLPKNILFSCNKILVITLLMCLTNIRFSSAQCVSQSAPTPQVGAHVNNFMLTNMWYSTNVRDYNPNENNGVVISKTDGWPVAGRKHFFNPYPTYGNLGINLKKDEIFKCLYKGTPEQLNDPNIWHGRIQNKQIYAALPGYTYFEIRVTKDNPEQFFFEVDGRITDIQLMMPGYQLFDQRLIRDEMLSHLKHWKALRFMNSVYIVTAQTWANRVPANAPMGVNGGPNPYTEKFDYNENNNDARGTSLELRLDIANYLNKDLWLTVPAMVDDNYVFEMAKVIKERLKPSLNVYIEIGNEIWNPGSPFNSFNMVKQKMWEEWNSGNAEYKKIFGGDFCPGCGIPAANTAGYTEPNKVDLDAFRRWQARRLKEYGDQFIKVFGDREAGGLGNRIRLILAGQYGYGGDGDGFNIGSGLSFLEKGYNDPLTPYKYLYGVAIAPYYKPEGTTPDASIAQIVEGVDKTLNKIFGEYDDETVNNGTVNLGNKIEGLLAKAKTYGLRLVAYEGGNELSTGGVGGKWENFINSDAYMKDVRSGTQAKKYLDNWFSWCGYDAIFFKNGDFQDGGYGISSRLNETNPLRMGWVNTAEQPAVPLATNRGGVIGNQGIVTLDARKRAAYWSNWDKRSYLDLESEVVNGKEERNTGDRYPWLLRCQKTGIYKIVVEGLEFKNNVTVADIYLNEKLMVKDFNFKPVTASSDGAAWSDTITMEIPYGVHALRIRPRAPIAPFEGTAYQDVLRALRIKVKQFKFILNSELPPAQPKAILGDQVVCKNNSKASYEVSELDATVCDYDWTGLPAGARILDKVQVPNTTPAKYFSGQTTFKIFIDWTAAAPGSYTLTVTAKNQNNAEVWQSSKPRTFNVKVENCGFTYDPNPVCTNTTINFKPEPMTNVAKVEWNFGAGAVPQFVVATSPAPVPVKYTTEATREVTLKITDNAGKPITYFGTVSVTSCNTPSVVSPVNLCKNAPTEKLTATATNGATILKWYDENGAEVTDAPSPATSSVGSKTYSVSQMNATGESEKVKIVVVVSDAPVKPEVSNPNPLVYCKRANATVANLISKITPVSGATLKWYLGNSTTGLATPTNTLTTTASEFVWNVTQSVGRCESQKAALMVSVKPGPEFTVEPFSPVNCGDKGKIVLSGLTAGQTYKVSYNTVAPADSVANIQGQIVLNLPQGNYKDFKVSQAGCSTTVATPYTLSDPLSPTFTVLARQPKECGALGGITLKGLKPNTAYKISYNNIVDEPKSTTADSIAIALPKGSYSGFKVSLNGCTKDDAGVYTLKDPVSIPLVEQVGNSNYCQNQVVNIADLTNRVKGQPNGQLKWYVAKDGIPTNLPEAPSTAVAGSKSVWVSQTIANCESDQLELKIQITNSTALIVGKQDPILCGSTDGKLEISGLGVIKEYVIEYKIGGESITLPKSYSNEFGKLTIGNLASGSYSSITATPILGNSCFTNSSESVILVAPGATSVPPTIAGADDYCAGTDPAALKATPNSGGTITWFSDAALTQNVGAGNTYQPPKVTATYYAVETVNNCKSPQTKATINIIANPSPQLVIGTNGAATCNGTGYPITLKSSERGVKYTVYKDNVPTSIFQNGTGDAISFPDQSEKGFYEIKAESQVKGCKADMTGNLTISEKVNPVVYKTAGGLIGCEGTESTANITLSGSEAYTEYNLKPSMEVKTGDGNPLSFAKPATAASNGTYTIIATNTQTGCDVLMDGEAKIDIKPGVSAPTVTGESSYCNNGTNKIAVAVEHATTTVWSITPTQAGTIDNLGNATWSNSYTGPATIKVVVRNIDCGIETKEATLSTTITTTPQVSHIMGDSLVCRGNIVTYQIIPQAGIIYNWSISASSTVEKDDSKGTITVTYMEDLGKDGAMLTVKPISTSCGLGDAKSKQINKDSGCDLYVPNILTPNTADNSSVWQLEGVENYPKLSIQIFNRWGTEVHSHSGKYSKPWDGTANGSPLPTATYYYVINKNDGTKSITGSVTVVRD